MIDHMFGFGNTEESYRVMIYGTAARGLPDRRIMWNKTARAAVGAASTGGVGRYVKYHLRK